jgi:ABC-type lipoprotein export system ATPase subunit
MDKSRELFARAGSNIQVRSLNKSYRVGDDTFSALTDVSCLIPRGRVSIIEGPSGCGKTTLMNILGGVDSADSGAVVVEGAGQIDRKDERALASYRLREVGFVFQSFNLIPGLTALDNLQLPLTVAGKGPEERQTRGLALLELVGMKGKAKKRPDELSGGEQQRVAIALALVNDPPFILADEPTGNLDTTNTAIVIDLLASLAHDFGKTVLITTHDPLVGERGDSIFRMRDGEIIEVHVKDGSADFHAQT